MDYFIPIVIGIVILFLLLVGIFGWVSDALKKARQKRLDEIARDTLAGFDFNKEKEEIKSIGSRYVSEEYRCPECGGMLVIRNGRYGKFWGCNRYPECTYTRNI